MYGMRYPAAVILAHEITTKKKKKKNDDQGWECGSVGKKKKKKKSPETQKQMLRTCGVMMALCAVVVACSPMTELMAVAGR